MVFGIAQLRLAGYCWLLQIGTDAFGSCWPGGGFVRKLALEALRLERGGPARPDGVR